MIHSDNEIKWLLQVKPYPIIPIHSDVFYANSLKFRSFINENENTLRNGLLVRARKCQDTNSLTCKFFEYLPLMALIIVRDKSADYSSRTHHIHTRDDLPNVRYQVFSYSNEAGQEHLVYSGTEDKIPYKALPQ